MERSAEASATRTSTWRSWSSPLSSRSAASNQRAAVAGARGAACSPGRDQQGDRLLVPGRGALLDVPRAIGRGRAQAPERRGGARVRRDAPARARGLIDRPADERVPEGEPARHVGRADEVALQQVVERVEGGLGVELRHGPCEIGLERLARDRRGVDQPPRFGGQRRQLLDERGGDRGRDPAAVRGAGVREGGGPGAHAAARGRTGCRRCCGTAPRPGRAARGLPEQRRRLGLAERREPQLGDLGARQRGEQPLRGLARPVGEGEQHRPVEPAAQQRADELQRGVVAPVQVVEHEHEPVLRGERLQQRLDRPVRAEAVVGHGAAVPGRRAPTAAGSRARRRGPLPSRTARARRHRRRGRRPRRCRGDRARTRRPRPRARGSPCASARSRSSRRSRVLPIPGSPATVRHASASSSRAPSASPS